MIANRESNLYRTPGSLNTTGSAPNRDRWLLSYADLLTLLLAFFVVMYSMSEVDVTKLSAISESFSGGIQSKLQGSGTLNPETVELQEVTTENSREKTNEELLTSLFDEEVAIDANQGDWVLITMDASVVFRTGSAEVVSINSLRDVALKLSVYDGEIIVEGHTDNSPISTERFPSNWELSAARAAAVVRLLEQAGISSARLNATGLADTRPLVSNATAEGRAINRRVVFRLKKNQLNSARLIAAMNARELEISNQPDPVEADPVIDDLPGEFDLDNIDPALLLQLLEQIEREGTNSPIPN